MDISILLLLLSAFIFVFVKKMRTSYLPETKGRFVVFGTIVSCLLILTYITTRNPHTQVNVVAQESYVKHITAAPAIPTKYQYKFFYGIMFDAGSTGSRIHVFQFQHVAPGKPYKLISELFKQTKPGLSNYAEFPKLGAQSLQTMLDEAKDMIPKDQWGHTPIELKATAGLRLLGQEQSDNILNEVRDLFKSYPFFTGRDCVSIMGGTDEGIFSWFTVNFLTGGIGDKENMAGMVDLGGGSVQITFIPKLQDTKNSAPEGYLKDIKIFSDSFKLYTHSYLGLGLMLGRFQMMGGSADNNVKTPETLTSTCFTPEFKGQFQHPSKKTYTVTGNEKGNNFENCYESAKKVIKDYKMHKVKETSEMPFVLMSYFYDRAVDSNILGTGTDGGEIPVNSFLKAAQQECTMTHRIGDFLCMDLCYLSALLQEGFGFPADRKVQVVKKIRNTELSWALGATFHMLNSQYNRFEDSARG